MAYAHLRIDTDVSLDDTTLGRPHRCNTSKPTVSIHLVRIQNNVGRHSSSCLASIATEEGAGGRSQAPSTTSPPSTTSLALALALALVVGCGSNRRDGNDGLGAYSLVCHDSTRGGRLGTALTRKMDLKDTILTGFLWLRRVD